MCIQAGLHPENVVWNLQPWLNRSLAAVVQCVGCASTLQSAEKLAWHMCVFPWRFLDTIPRDQIPEPWDGTWSSAPWHGCRWVHAGGPGPPFEKLREAMRWQRASTDPHGLAGVEGSPPPSRESLSNPSHDWHGSSCRQGVGGRSGPHRRGVHGQDAHVGRGAAFPAATDGKVPAVNVSCIILYIPCPQFLDELIEFKSFPSAYSI